MSIEGAYGFEGGSNVNVQTYSASGVYTFADPDFRPYLKGGLVGGKVAMSGLPGSFSNGSGWLAGGGFEMGDGGLSLKIDVLYRRLSCGYNKAAGAVSASSEFDLSGLGVAAGVVYSF